MGSARKEAAEEAVPATAVETLGRTISSLRDVETQLRQFLSMADPDALANLPPLQRAQVFLVLAKTATALFSVRLRCSGIRPEQHPVSKELERICLHEERFQKYWNWSQAPLRPSTTINRQAATRFIEHSLPDLTADQRKGLRNISRKGGPTSGGADYHGSKKKRKYQTSEKQSVRAAAQDFLEKAARELLGSDSCGLKGPLQSDIKNQEDAQFN